MLTKILTGTCTPRRQANGQSALTKLNFFNSSISALGWVRAECSTMPPFRVSVEGLDVCELGGGGRC